MDLFADYIQPFTNWLQENPNGSLFITFLISLTESLAIIGSIIPGSVTMTAIGILAGSGIMRLDLTLIAATLGAICGDSLSYALGFYYSDRLVEIWPFKKYPKWLQYGKEFFSRHGGKSVLIGRFIGPLRSLIPVIAGIMHMKQWRFLLANVLSAIGWSFLYIMPGVFIGAASHGLSAESATRLFLLILFILAVCWLGSLSLKYLFITLRSFLKRNLHFFWLYYFKKNHYLTALYQSLTPISEQDHFPTAALLLLVIFCSIFFISLSLLSLNMEALRFINIPTHLLMQSTYTPVIKAFFIACTQLTSILAITSLYIICCFWLVAQKQYKTIFYFTNTIISSALVALILALLINSPRPPGLEITVPGSSFLPLTLVVATAFYGFILFYINNKGFLPGSNLLRAFLLIILGLSGLGSIYLGDVWFTDVLSAYFAGSSLCLIHYLIYRKNEQIYLESTYSTPFFFSILMGILAAMALSTYLNFKHLSSNHLPFQEKYILSEFLWWQQQKPILPIYRLNRIGNRISLLNVQYAGDLELLQKILEKKNWKSHSESFITKLLMQMNTHSNDIKFPILTQLYENKAPELIMTYKESKSQLLVELNIWESNYYLAGSKNFLWIGTIHLHLSESANRIEHFINNPFTYILPALKDFEVKQIELPKSTIRATLFPTPPRILLIKEKT